MPELISKYPMSRTTLYSILKYKIFEFQDLEIKDELIALLKLNKKVKI